MRPAGITAGMIGLYETGRLTRALAPKTDPKPVSQTRDLHLSAYGLVLARVPLKTMPARALFPDGPEGDAQFAAHLDAVGARVRAGARNAKSRQAYAAPAATLPSLFLDGRPFSWEDLKTVRCAGCRRKLLGRDHERVRKQSLNRGRRGDRALRALPPPIAGHVTETLACGRTHARPVCIGCLPKGVA